ncbi:zinc-binding dehydrogenase [Chloroflexota bacterium]
MKAARVHEQGKIVMEEVPLPELGENDVCIKVHSAGICGTDAGVLHGYVPAKLPVTLGHEFSGTVAKLGSPSLGGFKVGDPVSAAGGWGCGECEFCRKGMVRFCKLRSGLGRTVDGCMAEFVKIDYRVVYRLPPNVPFEESQNFLNIACAVRAFKKAPLQLDNKVVIFGAGNMGLIMLQVIKLAGVSQVIMVDTIDFRLQIAKEFGATHIVNVTQENPVKVILELFPGGADVVMEATGNPLSFVNACAVIKAGGILVSVGMFSDKVKELDLSFLYQKEPIIYGTNGGEEGYHEALLLLGEKRLEIAPMITHRFPLEDTAKGFKTFDDKTANALRIVIEPSV